MDSDKGGYEVFYKTIRRQLDEIAVYRAAGPHTDDDRHAFIRDMAKRYRDFGGDLAPFDDSFRLSFEDILTTIQWRLFEFYYSPTTAIVWLLKQPATICYEVGDALDHDWSAWNTSYLNGFYRRSSWIPVKRRARYVAMAAIGTEQIRDDMRSLLNDEEIEDVYCNIFPHCHRKMPGWHLHNCAYVWLLIVMQCDGYLTLRGDHHSFMHIATRLPIELQARLAILAMTRDDQKPPKNNWFAPDIIENAWQDIVEAEEWLLKSRS
jgi:hypothetical protein